MGAHMILVLFLAAVLWRCGESRIGGSNPLSLLVRSFALHILPNLTLNSTMGHSDASLAIGLPLPLSGGIPGKVSEHGLTSADLLQVIPFAELNRTLDETLLIASQSVEEIKRAGWKVVHQSELFSLYKRRSLPNNEGPVEYLMTGKIDDVSPRTFLHSQINSDCRRVWDKTMKEMSAGSPALIQGQEGSDDSLYYRTKWPWPLKDRDYTLVRRCREFGEAQALVFCSRSTDLSSFARKEGVIRVDNYWCHSALFSTHGKKAGAGAGAGPPGAGALKSASASSVAQPRRGPEQAARGALGQAHRRRRIPRPRPHQKSHAPQPRFSLSGLFGKKAPQPRAGDSVRAAARGPGAVNCLDMPGMIFISVFCDDQKVPLPPRIVDMIASQVGRRVPSLQHAPLLISIILTPYFPPPRHNQAEKVVPDSISRLYQVAKRVEGVRAEWGPDRTGLLPVPLDFSEPATNDT